MFGLKDQTRTRPRRQVREMILGKRPKYMILTKYLRFTMSISTMSMSTMSTMSMSSCPLCPFPPCPCPPRPCPCPPCHMGMSYLISLTPMLLRNIAHDGFFKHFSFVYLCVYCVFGMLKSEKWPLLLDTYPLGIGHYLTQSID